MISTENFARRAGTLSHVVNICFFRNLVINVSLTRLSAVAAVLIRLNDRPLKLQFRALVLTTVFYLTPPPPPFFFDGCGRVGLKINCIGEKYKNLLSFSDIKNTNIKENI